MKASLVRRTEPLLSILLGLFCFGYSYAQIVPTKRLSIEADELIIGAPRIPIDEREDTLLFFDMEKAAFRAGEMIDQGWVKDSLGKHSFAAGLNVVAKGSASIAFGNKARAISSDAIALGKNVVASGRNTVAIGDQNSAIGNSTIAIGNNLSNSSFGSIVLGRFNVGGGNEFSWTEADPLFEIGNGSGTNNRANAMTMLKNGRTLLGKVNGGLQDRLTVNSEDNEDPFRVQVASSTKFRIFKNGSISLGVNNANVSDNDVYVHNELGVGASIPEAKLDVRGTSQIKMNSSTNNGPQLSLYETSNTDYARLEFRNQNPETFWTIAGRPNADVKSSKFNINLGSDQAMLTILGNENVGIGTETPTQKLDVNGAIKLGLDSGSPENGTLRYRSTGLEIYHNNAWNIIDIKPKKYEIGDEAFGGIIFWIDEDGEHGLVVSDVNFPSNAPWGTDPCCPTQAFNKFGIYGGYFNTLAIIFDEYHNGSAASAIATSFINGYGDWYLPNSSEFRELYNASLVIDNINLTANWYWTSREDTDTSSTYRGYARHGGTGEGRLFDKDESHYLRPIRRF